MTTKSFFYTISNMKTTGLENKLITALKIGSYSGNEGAFCKYIEKIIPKDFSIKKHVVSKGRYNITASRGNSNVWIVCHTDTVPGDVPIRITKDKIFGRGAIDNKGNIISAIEATRLIGDINFLFTVGEEVDFAGARASKDLVNGVAIVMEPTNFKIRTSQCGVISFNIVSKGVRAHSSLDVGIKNHAMNKMMKTLNELLKQKWHRLNIGPIEGGVAANIISKEIRASLSVRPKSVDEFKTIMSYLSAIKEVKIDIINALKPKTKSIAIKGAIEDPVAFFSELAFFERGVVFGVGDINLAHTDTEHILRRDLELAPSKISDLVASLSK